MLLPTTAVGLRWKSFKRLLRWVQGEKDLSRTFFFFTPSLISETPFCFSASIIYFFLLSSAELTSYSHFSEKWRRSSNIPHANMLLIILIFPIITLIVILFTVTLAAVFTLIGSLKWYQKLSPLFHVEATSSPSSLPVGFWLMSLRLDVSNLPLKIPSKWAAKNKWLPGKLSSSSRALPEMVSECVLHWIKDLGGKLWGHDEAWSAFFSVLLIKHQNCLRKVPV